jgi:hypothetical protein
VCDETVEVLALTASKAQPVDDVPVRATWDRLAASPNAVLIDVRTRAEWSYVGLADLSSLGKQPVLVEWLTFPDNRVNPAFVDELTRQLDALGADQRRRPWRPLDMEVATTLPTVLREPSTTSVTGASGPGGKQRVCPGRRAETKEESALGVAQGHRGSRLAL